MEYQVDLFIIGCDPTLTKETVVYEGKTQDEAEELAQNSAPCGYGVFSSRPRFEADLSEALYKEDIDTVEEYLEAYGSLEFCDEKIDDGIDDEDCEDEYLMMRSYYLQPKDGPRFYLRLYYGNNSRLFTYYDCRQE